MKRLGIKAEDFDWIVAIGRGGLVPAALIAQLTGIRRIDILPVWSYTDENQRGKLQYRRKDFSHFVGERILLVDDLVDSGETMKLAVELIAWWQPGSIKTAVIYKKRVPPSCLTIS